MMFFDIHRTCGHYIAYMPKNKYCKILWLVFTGKEDSVHLGSSSAIIRLVR
ncbi:MAG: hypothetical protein LBT46_09015 [Planctomycetaceae bacterium]|nr:hypothetical protein [Planctomycetaceae bacterium]